MTVSAKLDGFAHVVGRPLIHLGPILTADFYV